MINYLKGILVHKNPVEAIIETASGLAFEVRIPISTFEVLPEPGKPCQLFTHCTSARTTSASSGSPPSRNAPSTKK